MKAKNNNAKQQSTSTTDTKRLTAQKYKYSKDSSSRKLGKKLNIQEHEHQKTPYKTL